MAVWEPPEVMVQQLTMPPPPLHEHVATIPLGIEQVVLRALAKDPKARFATVHDFATALEQASQRALIPTAQLASEQPALSPAAAAGYDTVAVAPDHPVLPAESTPEASLPVGAFEPTAYPGSLAPHGLDTPQSQAAAETPLPGQAVAPTAAVLPHPLEPTLPVHRRTGRFPGRSRVLLVGLVVLVIAAGLLGSLSLLTHFGVLGAHSGPPPVQAVRGGAWTQPTGGPHSLIPNGGDDGGIDQALYLPLFYGDAQGAIHPGAATEVPTIGNGGVSPDATTWTFHLRPGLVWSDGAPYDARDVDYTWKLWRNPAFRAAFPFGATGLLLISSATVSADHLSITFHLTRPFVPFLADLWMDGFMAPLPAHHFSTMAPEQILKSPENLNPKVVSGPFMMSESVPGVHYTVLRNPRYYRASEGLPYLDKVFFTENTNWCTTPSPAQGPPCLQVSILDTSGLFSGIYPDLKNILLDDDGWVRGPDGVRARDGQRLEFEYSTNATGYVMSHIRLDVESIIQRDFRQIGIKLDIQNYPGDTFFGSFLPGGKASPPTGAVAGRYDIAEFEQGYGYDPDDSFLGACDQFPPQGQNVGFYCNHALDALYQQEQTTLDPGLRQQIFRQIHRVYLTQYPFIVLYSPVFFELVRKGTHNYQPGPVTETYNIAEWWCDGGKC